MPRADGTPTIDEIIYDSLFPEAYCEGWEANISSRRKGFFAATKYPPGTPERAEWERGWREGAEDPIPPWPPEDDCPTCPGHRLGTEGHPDGGHKMSCTLTKGGLTLSLRREGEDFAPMLDPRQIDPLLGPVMNLHAKMDGKFLSNAATRDLIEGSPPVRQVPNAPVSGGETFCVKPEVGTQPAKPLPEGSAGTQPPYSETFKRREKP